jgi:crotonobetainyl-CoA:carnitine CoA-transferase CaiB-like acyl-CoA transferase
VFFTFQNADKKSLALDLETEQDRAVLRRLIASADVLVENLRPGALAKRGLSPEAIAGINPRLVYCAISGFGADSIYAGRPAFDTVIQAMSGLMDVNRIDGMPLKTGPSLADVMGAAVGLVAMIAALEFRDRTGEGQCVDLSMQDIGAWATQAAWNREDALPQRFVPVQCSDGYALVEREPAEAAARAGAMPVPGSLSRAALIEALRGSGVRAVPVLALRDVVAAPQTRERALWFTVEENGAAFPLLASPWRLHGTPAMTHRPAPPLGRDSVDILASLGA